MARQKQRLSLGSSEIDAMLGGGFINGSAVLVRGAPGVGKTTLGLQFLMAGIKAGQRGLLVSFEEFPASLIRDAQLLGWDLKSLEQKGDLGIIFTSPQVFLESLKQQTGPISEKIDSLAPTRMVLDSVAHFQQFTRDPLELREIYNTLVNAIKRQDSTVLLLDEAANIVQQHDTDVAALPFLVDTVILLRYVEVNSTMQRAIAVMKMRGSSHQKEIRSFEIKNGGLALGPPFTGHTGILSGMSHRTA
ncbi:MAG: hypothetical protein KDJ52_11820 [Anaerolineae bacterium]|nr:hypothetical protein [Anaerolineae bacterium]